MIRKPTEIRQEEIKKAVLEIIYRNGLKKLSTKNIAKEVGISEGSIFRHFGTKNDIIMSIMDDVIKDFIEPLREISLQNEHPEQRLYKHLCKTITYLKENRGITLLLFSEASYENDDEMKEKLIHIFQSQRQLVGKIVSDGIAMQLWDESVSTDSFSQLYMGIPITLNVEIALKKEDIDVQSFCKHNLDMLLKILSK
ncbi:MAG: TetR/AcrR family transcriptional regulator [Chlorobi bacterium]|nr:TetR/AcrR family transcriptional regulator [Chlorobiota bacterium]